MTGILSREADTMSSIQVDPQQIIDRLRREKSDLQHQNMLLELAFVDLQTENRKLKGELDSRAEADSPGSLETPQNE